jgi:hypothetical protein
MPKSLIDLLDFSHRGVIPIVLRDAAVEWMRNGMPGVDASGPPQPVGGSGLLWLGPWDTNTLYLIDDVVSYQGSSYVAVASNQSQSPPSASWNLVASKGDTGNTGSTGAPGPNSVTAGVTTTSITGLLKGDGALVQVASAPSDYVATADSRLSDSRSPTAHKASHQHGGSDEVATATAGANAIPKAGAGGKLAVGWITAVLASSDLTNDSSLEKTANKNAASGYAGLDGSSKLTGSQQVYGTTANTACVGNDSRLSDSRVPTAHASTHLSNGSDAIAAASTTVRGTVTTTTATSQVASNDDSRLSDARTPLAHATSHKSGGTDAIALDTLGVPTDITTLDATTVQHGLMMKYPGGTSNFLRADGTFASPGASSTPTKETHIPLMVLALELAI